MKALRMSLSEYEAANFKRSAELAKGPAVSIAKPKARGMNKLESRYAERLEMQRRAGVVVWWGYEKIKLRLAEGTWYRPDFLIVRTGGQMVIDETKGGFYREAARVRLNVAAELYPCFEFRLVRWVGGQWTFERIPTC